MSHFGKEALRIWRIWRVQRSREFGESEDLGNLENLENQESLENLETLELQSADSSESGESGESVLPKILGIWRIRRSGESWSSERNPEETPKGPTQRQSQAPRGSPRLPEAAPQAPRGSPPGPRANHADHTDTPRNPRGPHTQPVGPPHAHPRGPPTQMPDDAGRPHPRKKNIIDLHHKTSLFALLRGSPASMPDDAGRCRTILRGLLFWDSKILAWFGVGDLKSLRGSGG